MRSAIRRAAYRIGRKLYMSGHMDLPNRPATNGEYWLVDQMLRLVPPDSIVLDIGANKGEWTAKVLRAASVLGKSLRVIAFEPCTTTRSMLASRFAHEQRVEVLGTALSAESGYAFFYANVAGSGTNSLHPVSGDQRERVAVTTLDDFLGQRRVRQIAFAKIDVEGFDALVLKGARRTLAAGQIELLQFEYNWRWLLNSMSLRAVFDMVDGIPYRVGKLAGCKLLLFERWHFEMDRFFESNYVLVHRGGMFDSIALPAWFDESNVLRW
jgi:FkbM family methyltransferase